MADEDTYEAGEFTLRKVRDHVWEMPREGDMRVPARVLASEPLLDEISEDRTLEQLRNTTHLPGVRKHAICMPDGHQGYGFPVGGVAGIDAERGCISPGAVGYDINCLPGETRVTLAHGRRIPIRELADRFERERAVVSAVDERVESPIRLFTESEPRTLYELETVDGDTIRATADHPFETPDGMVELDALEPGSTVFVDQFAGLDDEAPEEFVVLDESDFSDQDPQLVSSMKRTGLLPLKSTDDAFARLLKLVGFHTGDGSFAGEQTWFYAEPEDLERIREDIEALGYTPSRAYTRERKRERNHDTDAREFTRTGHSLTVGARGFKQLLVKLGAPTGPKTGSTFTTPEYLDRLAGWQRALYVAAYFGAEMNAPSPRHDESLHCPTVSQSRDVAVADAGEQFFRELASHLTDLNIETNGIERADAGSRDGVERLRLGITNDAENLVRFYSTVGYRYNAEKRRLAAIATQYLKRKQKHTERHEQIAAGAVKLADGGTSAPEIEEFQKNATVRDDATVATEIERVERAGEERVYDIGVDHDAHDFLADGFVVSNCGVRMVNTTLTYDDVRGREEELVGKLFEAIPSGLGGGGVVEGDRDTIEAILARGVDWALEEGYAVESDLARCEDEGRRPDADPDAVSQKAKDRGRNQIGSLGSGNHFLEVQRVTDVYRADVADAYGLAEDRVVVLIHCGSRGLGHQTCNDYLRDIEDNHPSLLAELPDKELAAAPAGSQLAEDYYGAMCAAINFAWVNRQLVTHQTRQVFADVFDRDWRDLDMELLYDVAHNIAKKEVHDLGDEERELYVHRKGATRAFPAGHPEVPAAYGDVGQPVLIPGSMGAGSYVLRGGEASLAETFGSTAHGAGRLMSRTQAKDEFWGGDVQDDLRTRQQVYVKANSGATIAEEAPGVYKNVDEVVRVSDALGIGDRVARTFPVCNIKG